MSVIKLKLSPFRFLFLLIGILLIMTLCRGVFWWSNKTDFSNIALSDWIVGVWFDLVTMGLFFLPFVAVYFAPIPAKWSNALIVRWIKNFLFITTSLLLIFFNLIDVEYFKFTKKRSTQDIFDMVQGGNDLSQQIGTYFADFWGVMLIFSVIVIGLFTWKKFVYAHTKSIQLPWYFALIRWITVLVTCVFIGRGGFVLKPISPIDASQFTSIENSAFVLNTPFTLVKSWNKQGLDKKNYFSDSEMNQFFQPIHTTQPQHILPNKTNVMVLILESFGNEWVGAAGAQKSFTPYFDSLISKSLYFKNGISNGKKSIEAVSSIFASIPTLMDHPYISSSYGNNRIESLVHVLKKEGYESAFFHGATNGSMKFDGFAAQAGFNHYFGRSEYNNEAHFDKSWGILDAHFNPWTAKKISTLKAPFIASLFTLSSHHPYYIPSAYRGKLRKGKEPICEAIHYADESLRLFFETAKKQPWFSNTLFVLCADHTPATKSSYFNQRTQLFKIPIVFYHPSGKIAPKKVTTAFQHLAIYPTVLDLLNIKANYYSFGTSYFQDTLNEAINYIEGGFNYYKGERMLTFSKDVARNLYNVEEHKKRPTDSLQILKYEAKKMERRLKAIIQRYNKDVAENKTTTNEKEHLLYNKSNFGNRQKSPVTKAD